MERQTVYVLKIILFLGLLGLSCNKSKEELRTLPPETQSGANTIGFKVNKDVWTTNGKFCFNQWGNCRENPEANYFSFGGGRIGISADRVIYKGLAQVSSESFEIGILRNFNRTGVYKLSGIDTLYEVFLRRNLITAQYDLLPNRETFEVRVTRLDTLAKIVSGTFAGILYRRDNLSDSIIISEGRFDLKWYQ